MILSSAKKFGVMILLAILPSGCSSLSAFQRLVDHKLDSPLVGEVQKRYALDDMQVSLDLSLKSEVIVDYSENRITSFPPRSHFAVRTRDSSGFTKELSIVSSASGSFSRDYSENSIKQDFDQNASLWWRKVLPSIYRETGFDYNNRIQHIVSSGGTSSALSEASLIHSDMVMALYLRVLVKDYYLTFGEYEQAIQISEKIDSDSNYADFLEALVSSKAPDELIPVILSSASHKISSSSELARVIIQVIRKRELDDELKERVLVSANAIASSKERKRVINLLNRKTV